MALSVRRRDHDQQTTRAPAMWEPFRELDELQRRTADLMEAVWSRGTPAGADLPWVPPRRRRGDRRRVDRRGRGARRPPPARRGPGPAALVSALADVPREA